MGEESFYLMCGIFSPSQGFMILLPDGVRYGFDHVYNILDKRIVKCLPTKPGLTEDGPCLLEQILPWWQKQIPDANICSIPVFEKKKRKNIFLILKAFIFKKCTRLISFLKINNG